jgi:ribosomal protein S18 acetylase RimI-like enzyme
MKRTIKRLVHHLIYERNEAYWYRRELSRSIPSVAIDLPVEIGLSDPEETISWLKRFDEPWMYDEKEIRTGLAEGHYFANAKLQGTIIGYSKVGRTRVYISDYTTVVSLPEGAALLYHIYVQREYRKHNVAKYLLARLLEECRAKGLSSMSCQIAVWNEPSMRLFSSLGFERIAHVKYVKLFGVLRRWRIRREGEPRFTAARAFSLESLWGGGVGRGSA